MLKQLSKRQKGFTIIEVMIVLAIAALILLAVFLAVPALQRNSRNTQRKNDVAAVLGAINEYTSNNQGALPTCLVSDGVNHVAVSGAAAGSTYAQCSAGTGNVIANQSGQFTSASIAAYSAGQATAANVMKVYTGATCNGNTMAAGSGRAIAVIYQVEPATDQCTGS